MAKWVIEFWDSDAWNELVNAAYDYKAQAIEDARRLNKETSHEVRATAFCGHRYRVRKRFRHPS